MFRSFLLFLYYLRTQEVRDLCLKFLACEYRDIIGFAHFIKEGFDVLQSLVKLTKLINHWTVKSRETYPFILVIPELRENSERSMKPPMETSPDSKTEKKFSLPVAVFFGSQFTSDGSHFWAVFREKFMFKFKGLWLPPDYETEIQLLRISLKIYIKILDFSRNPLIINMRFRTRTTWTLHLKLPSVVLSSGATSLFWAPQKSPIG